MTALPLQRFVVAAGVALLLGASGLACAVGAPARQLPVAPEPQEQFVYRLLPGDHLLVKLVYTPELSQDVIVRPDGHIHLPVVGEVRAAGRTPADLAVELKERYAQLARQPEVAILIQGFGGHRIYVGGEVKTPKMIPLDSVMSVVDAVFEAGGLKETAAPDSVVLLRRGEPGQAPRAYRVDLEAGLYARAPLPRLEPYDVVYVPKSRIAKVNDYVELYINRMIPHASSFGVVYGIGFD
jgi:protein involved in polysaccharide export with SLBB domain